MLAESIPSMVYYSKPLHEQKAFSDLHRLYCSLDNTVELCRKVLSLPMHPYMGDWEIEAVIEKIGKGIVK